MKKITVPLITLALALAVAVAAYAAQDAIHPRVFVDGKEIHPDVPAYIENNRTMLPYRAIAEALGAVVDWSEVDQSVTVRYDGKTVVMRIGQYNYTVNGLQKTLDVLPVIRNNRTMVPVRALAEGLGCEVRWDGINYIVYVISPKAKNSGTLASEYPSFQGAPDFVVDKVTKNWRVQEPASLPYTNYKGFTVYSYQIGSQQVHVTMSSYNDYALIIKKKDGTWTQSAPAKDAYVGAYTVNSDGTVTVHYPLYHAGEWLSKPEDIAEMYILIGGMYIRLPY